MLNEHNNNDSTTRELILGWRGFIIADLRDKPTRDACNDGIFILLVGKPNGAEDRRFERSDITSKKKIKFLIEQRDWIDHLLVGFCWICITARGILRSIDGIVDISKINKIR